MSRDTDDVTDDVKGVIFYSLVSNSGCSCARAMNFFVLFSTLFRSRKSFQILPIASLLRVTLKPKKTSWSTWLMNIPLLVFVLPRWIFSCFVRFLGHRIYSNYRRLRDLHASPWNWRSRHGLRDLCYFCSCSSYRDDFLLVCQVFSSMNSF